MYKDVSAIIVFSLKPMRTIDKTLLPTIVFLRFLSNLRVKLPNITKIIEDDNFEDMPYRFYILLLFGFVFDYQNKKKIYCTFKLCLNCFKIIFRQIDIIPSKILFSIVF